MPGTHFNGPIGSEEGFEGDLTGDVTGDVTGDIEGDLAGGDVTIESGKEINIEDGGAFKINDIEVDADADELDFNDGAIAGTLVASKTLVADSNKRINEIIVGTATEYALFDPVNKYFVVYNTRAGGDSPKAMLVVVDVLAGAGYRQGAIQIQLDRGAGQDVTWDGNPDCGLKILVNNRAANLDNEGAVRAIDVAARNRGANTSWVNGMNIGARNDSGSITYSLIGIQTRLENYGTVNTEVVGLDVNLSIENDTGAPTKAGIQVRNTDQSGMSAVDDVIKISHTSTNGFTHLFNFAGASGDVIASGSLSDSGTADIKCDARIPIVWNGGTYYLAAYDTAV